MKERGILMGAESVRAILAGRKTQTRRVVKPQPSRWDGVGPLELRGRELWWTDLPYFPLKPFAKCPYEAGQMLWVRETWRVDGWTDYKQCIGNISYRADEGCKELAFPCEWLDRDNKVGIWRPSVHMPRWASRITLRVTSVQVERVQEISYDDIIAEGITEEMLHGWPADISFQALWNGTSRKRGFGWDVNPWVWVVSFEIADGKGIEQ